MTATGMMLAVVWMEIVVVEDGELHAAQFLNVPL